MILFLTGLVVAILQLSQPTVVTTFEPAQPTVVAELQQATPTVVADFEQPVLEGVPLEATQPTVVETWTVEK